MAELRGVQKKGTAPACALPCDIPLGGSAIAEPCQVICWHVKHTVSKSCRELVNGSSLTRTSVLVVPALRQADLYSMLPSSTGLEHKARSIQMWAHCRLALY